MGQSHPRVGKKHRQQFRTDGRLTAASRVLYAARAERILSLRVTGLSESQIGIQEDISYRAVHSIIRASIRRKTSKNPEAVQLRELELDRLDQLQQGIWAEATGTLESAPGIVNLKAVGKVLSIMERRARLLGLDLSQDSTQGETIRLTLEQLVIQSGIGQEGTPSPGVSEALPPGSPSHSILSIPDRIAHSMGAVPDAEFTVGEEPRKNFPSSGEGPEVEPFTDED